MSSLAMLQPGDVVEAEKMPGSWYQGKIESVSADHTSCWVRFPGFGGTHQYSGDQIRTLGSAATLMPRSSARRAEESISRLTQRPAATDSAAADQRWAAQTSNIAEGPEAPPEPLQDVDYSQQQSQQQRWAAASTVEASAAQRARDDESSRELQEQVRKLQVEMAEMTRNLRDERTERETLEQRFQRETETHTKRLETTQKGLDDSKAEAKQDREKAADEQARLSKQVVDLEALFEELCEMVTDVEAQAKDALEGEAISQLHNDSSDAKDALVHLMDTLEK
jgi:chromosome segregation ATPase